MAKKYEDLAVRFRQFWNENNDIKCWVDPEDENKEYAPFREMWLESESDLQISKWYKKHRLAGWKMDFALTHPDNDVQYCLAVEIDGVEHLRPAVAEKDRHKCNKLQEYGWIILRFSAETVYGSFEYTQDCIRDVLEKDELWY